MSITAGSCASCVLGATSTALLSFTYQTIETITVKVVPHITVYTSGSSTSSTTNYVSITEIETDYVGSGNNRTASKTFDHTDHLTWMVGDATLTYPTTYVQYLGFAGAAVPNDDGEKCATGTDSTSLVLPTSTDASAFIYPYTSGATSLPGPLLQYLQGQAPFAAQFSGQPLTGCAGLDYIPPATTSSIAPYSSATLPSSAASFSSLTISTGNYTRTTKLRTGGPTRLTPGQPEPTLTSSQAPAPIFSSFTAGVPSYESTQSHSTAFVIQPVTAPHAIITTLPGGSNTHTGGGDEHHTTTKTTKHHNDHPPGYDTTSDDHNTATAIPVHQPGGDHTRTGDNNHVTPGTQNNDHTRTKPNHVYTLGSSEITAKPHGPVTIAGHTLHRGETITIGQGPSATTVALQSHRGHDRLIVNGKTQKAHPETTAAPSAHAVITAGGHTLTAVDENSSVILHEGSKTITLRDGSQTTFHGHVISVGPHGSSLVVDGKTTTLTTSPTSQITIITGGHTITALDMSGYVRLVDGSTTKTVKDGRTVTFESQTFAVPASGTAVVVNGKTVQLTTSTSTSASKTTTGIGDYVHSGLGGGGTPSATVQPADTNAATTSVIAGADVLWTALLAALSLLLML